MRQPKQVEGFRRPKAGDIVRRPKPIFTGGTAGQQSTPMPGRSQLSTTRLPALLSDYIELGLSSSASPRGITTRSTTFPPLWSGSTKIAHPYEPTPPTHAKAKGVASDIDQLSFHHPEEKTHTAAIPEGPRNPTFNSLSTRAHSPFPTRSDEISTLPPLLHHPHFSQQTFKENGPSHAQPLKPVPHPAVLNLQREPKAVPAHQPATHQGHHTSTLPPLLPAYNHHETDQQPPLLPAFLDHKNTIPVSPKSHQATEAIVHHVPSISLGTPPPIPAFQQNPTFSLPARLTVGVLPHQEPLPAHEISTLPPLPKTFRQNSPELASFFGPIPTHSSDAQPTKSRGPISTLPTLPPHLFPNPPTPPPSPQLFTSVSPPFPPRAPRFHPSPQAVPSTHGELVSPSNAVPNNPHHHVTHPQTPPIIHLPTTKDPPPLSVYTPKETRVITVSRDNPQQIKSITKINSLVKSIVKPPPAVHQSKTVVNKVISTLPPRYYSTQAPHKYTFTELHSSTPPPRVGKAVNVIRSLPQPSLALQHQRKYSTTVRPNYQSTTTGYEYSTQNSFVTVDLDAESVRKNYPFIRSIKLNEPRYQDVLLGHHVPTFTPKPTHVTTFAPSLPVHSFLPVREPLTNVVPSASLEQVSRPASASALVLDNFKKKAVEALSAQQDAKIEEEAAHEASGLILDRFRKKAVHALTLLKSGSQPEETELSPQERQPAYLGSSFYGKRPSIQFDPEPETHDKQAIEWTTPPPHFSRSPTPRLQNPFQWQQQQVLKPNFGTSPFSEIQESGSSNIVVVTPGTLDRWSFLSSLI